MMRRRNLVSHVNAGMINGPSISPVTGVAGQGLPKVGTDNYLALKVDTTALSVPTDIILFDASRGLQIHENYAMPLGVVITGITSDYQFMLNDLSHIGSYFDLIKQTIDDETKAYEQYANPVKVYSSSKGSDPRLIKTLYPDMGLHEGQYQKGINTFIGETLLDNRIAFKYKQSPGIVMTWSFYQKAEVGRKQ